MPKEDGLPVALAPPVVWFPGPMTLTDFPQVQRLSTAEKLQLLGELWDSIAADPQNVPVSAQKKILLEERWQEHVRHPQSALSLGEFKRRLNEKL